MDPIKLSNRRLLKLARQLDDVPDHRFDYCSWAGNDWEGKEDLSCGTTACALGWATTIPTFKRLKLKLMRQDGGNEDRRIFVGLADKKYKTNTNTFSASIRSAQEVFLLSEADASFLFTPAHYSRKYKWKSPDSYSSAAEVADHIRKFVGERK